MKRNSFIFVILVFAMLLICFGCGTSKSSERESTYKHLEADEAASMIEAGDCVLVDVRSKDEFEIEHIPDAINIPYDSEDDAFTSALPDKEKPLLLYCDYGGISKDTAEHLVRDLGYENVSEFDGLLVWEGDTVSGE